MSVATMWLDKYYLEIYKVYISIIDLVTIHRCCFWNISVYTKCLTFLSSVHSRTILHGATEISRI